MSDPYQDYANEHGISCQEAKALLFREVYTISSNDNADYREVFGRDPEPWRMPLGALRLTLADESAPPWQLKRARDECEELTKVLNEYQAKLNEARGHHEAENGSCDELDRVIDGHQ